IQSDVAWRSDLRDFTVPAMEMALPISSSFSVMVVLPASGWEMMAKVRRFATSAAWWVMGNRLAGESKKGADYSLSRCNNRTVQHMRGGQLLSCVGTFQTVETSTPLIQPPSGSAKSTS